MLRKFAHFQIIGVYTQDEMKTQTLGPKTAHRAHFDFTPRHGFIYVRSRMISSRCNDNFDEFPAEEIKKAYSSFIGKPVFVNHHNEDHNDMRGVIIDAALHEDRNPDGSPDTWVEGLMEVDALRFPKLAVALIKGDIQRTSMGVDVQASECSRCGNRASTPLEYCRHIPGMKGKRVYSFTASGARKSELIRERCYGLGFFENSLLVEPPADPTAYTLGQPVLGPGLEHLSRTAAARHGDVMAGRLKPADMSDDDLFDTDVALTDIASALGQRGKVTPAHGKVRKEIEKRMKKPQRKTAARRPVTTPALTVLGSLQMLGALCGECGSLHTVALRGTAECLDCSAVWQPGQPRRTTAAPRYPNPADHPWFQKYPVSSKNIVDHWNQATDDEKTQGKNWYADAHILAKSLGNYHHLLHGKHPNGPTHLAAGIIANYSPQQGWAGNMHNAGRVLHENKGIGGPGSGMFASNHQKTAADRMLSGEAYQDVLGGPKIQDFAHLIEHGGDANPATSHVVIDRHALSVAAGQRMSDDAYGAFPKTQRHYYGHVADQYREAGQQIGKQEGLVVPGHAVQATTWLTRQRLNQEGEKAAQGQHANNDRLNKGREVNRNNAQQGWDTWRKQHLPDSPSAGPGTGYQKAGRRQRIVVGYGETKAPADVDTLRDDTCPVCGEENAYDGNECQVCGFQAPPKQFQDPDLDLARRVDLRKDNADLDGTDVGDLNADLNDQDKDGLDDETGQPIGDEGGDGGDIQPMLSCSNCGTEFEAGEPTTTDTRDPQVGDSGDGPDAGDVCPVCGKGVLETGTEMAGGEMAGADPDDDADRSEGPPEEDSAQEPGNDAPPGEEDEADGEAEGNPFGARPSDDEGDSDPDEQDQDDDGDDADDAPPAKKKSNPFKR